MLTWSETAIYLGARKTLLSQLDQALLAVTDTEVASAIDGPRLHLHESVLAQPGYQRYAVILRPGGPILARSDNLDGGWPRWPALERTHRPVLTDLPWQHQLLRAVYFPLPGQEAVAVVALPRAPVDRALGSLVTILAGVLLAGGILSAGLSWWLALYLSRPLQELALAAAKIGPARLDLRLEGARNEDRELGVLRQVLNEMLAQLEQAFASQKRFLSDASHELRTPLTNLIGRLEVTLRRPRSRDEYVACLERALGESRRMARLVRDLLTLAQADEGRLLIHPEPLDGLILLAACRDGFLEAARAQQVTIHLECPPGLSILADPDRLRQVLDNLLDNALRYAPAGSVVSLEGCQAGAEVELRVRDAGPGLSPQEQAQLFQRFARPDPSRSRETGGTGLGLAIVRELVLAHGGDVRLEPGPDQGACFLLRLPRATRLARDLPPEAGRGGTSPARSPG